MPVPPPGSVSAFYDVLCWGVLYDSVVRRCMFPRGMDDDATLRCRYVTAMYWAMSTMATVGYGDVTPIQVCPPHFILSPHTLQDQTLRPGIACPHMWHAFEPLQDCPCHMAGYSSRGRGTEPEHRTCIALNCMPIVYLTYSSCATVLGQGEVGKGRTWSGAGVAWRQCSVVSMNC